MLRFFFSYLQYLPAQAVKIIKKKYVIVNDKNQNGVLNLFPYLDYFALELEIDSNLIVINWFLQFLFIKLHKINKFELNSI